MEWSEELVSSSQSDAEGREEEDESTLFDPTTSILATTSSSSKNVAINHQVIVPPPSSSSSTSTSTSILQRAIHAPTSAPTSSASFAEPLSTSSEATAARLGLQLDKAGLDNVNLDKVNKIIFEMSKNSRFFLNEQKKNERTKKQGEEMKARLDAIIAKGLHSAPATIDKVDALTLAIERKRHLSRSWLHVDMDAFFASVEIRDNPSLKGKPIAIGGSAMISTASYEARKYGVRSAMPGFIGKKLCPDLLFVKPNFTKYKEAARIIRTVFEEYDPNFAPMSLDEASLDISDHLLAHPDSSSASVATEIQKKIFEQTRLTASIGGAPNARLAKVCADINKPNGQYHLQPNRDAIVKFVRGLEVRKIGGVGRVTEQLLRAVGVRTVADMWEKRYMLCLLFSESNFEFFMKICLGIGRSKHSPPQPRKSVSTTRTIRPTRDPDTVLKLLFKQCHQVGDYLKDHGIVGRTVTLVMKYSTFKVKNKSLTLPLPTNDPKVIYSTSSDLLKAVLPAEIRLVGVRMSNLSRGKTKKRVDEEEGRDDDDGNAGDPAVVDDLVDESDSIEGGGETTTLLPTKQQPRRRRGGGVEQKQISDFFVDFTGKKPIANPPKEPRLELFEGIHGYKRMHHAPPPLSQQRQERSADDHDNSDDPKKSQVYDKGEEGVGDLSQGWDDFEKTKKIFEELEAEVLGRLEESRRQRRQVELKYNIKHDANESKHVNISLRSTTHKPRTTLTSLLESLPSTRLDLKVRRGREAGGIVGDGSGSTASNGPGDVDSGYRTPPKIRREIIRRNMWKDFKGGTGYSGHILHPGKSRRQEVRGPLAAEMGRDGDQGAVVTLSSEESSPVVDQEQNMPKKSMMSYKTKKETKAEKLRFYHNKTTQSRSASPEVVDLTDLSQQGTKSEGIVKVFKEKTASGHLRRNVNDKSSKTMHSSASSLRRRSTSTTTNSAPVFKYNLDRWVENGSTEGVLNAHRIRRKRKTTTIAQPSGKRPKNTDTTGSTEPILIS